MKENGHCHVCITCGRSMDRFVVAAMKLLSWALYDNAKLLSHFCEFFNRLIVRKLSFACRNRFILKVTFFRTSLLITENILTRHLIALSS